MPFDYLSSANTADSLLKNFGKEVELRVHDTGTLDPVTGEVNSPSHTSGLATGVILSGGSRSDPKGNSKRDSRQVTMERRKMYITPKSSIAPVVGVVAIVEGSAWDIVASHTLSPAGVTVLYTCILERSSRVA